MVGRVLGPAVVATSLTAMAVTAGVAGSSPAVDVPASAGAAALNSAGASANLESLSERGATVSRSATRVVREVTLKPQASGHKWATSALNLWREPGEVGKVGLIDAGSKLAVTGKVIDGWAEILRDGQVRFVNAKYLSAKKPVAGAAVGGLSMAPCPDGSAIEAGLTDAADRVYRAVCAAFPQPSVYGGRDPHGEHVDGRAIDIMITGSVGDQIAEWLRANAAALQIRSLIWSQRIWTPERAGEGWRYMSDRGSVTANHYDHVHVAVY